MTGKEMVAAYMQKYGLDFLESPSGECGCSLTEDFVKCADEGYCGLAECEAFRTKKPEAK